MDRDGWPRMATSFSSIEWTEAIWNPIRGCTRVSPGCEHCYAERLAARFSAPELPFYGLAKMTRAGPRWTNTLRLVDHLLDQPLRWRRPRLIFVNSMSDLYHEKLPLEAIQCVFKVMQQAYWHRFQILTKRSGRLRELSPHLFCAQNIWQGVSVENSACLFRIDDLRQTAAAVKFLSLEPLLGPLPNLKLHAIDWVIVGSESGPGARAMDPGWVRDIREHCIATGIPFFFKQWGALSNNPDRNDPTATTNGGAAKGGRMLDGRFWNKIP